VKSLTGAGSLHFAAIEGDRAMVEKFLHISGGINEQNNNGKTPLHVAAEKGNIDGIKVLLNGNVTTTTKDVMGRVAAECGKITAYKMISEHKPGMKYEYVTADDDEDDKKGVKKDDKKEDKKDDKKKKKSKVSIYCPCVRL